MFIHRSTLVEALRLALESIRKNDESIRANIPEQKEAIFRRAAHDEMELALESAQTGKEIIVGN